MSALNSVLKSIKDPETKADYLARSEKAREAFENRMAIKIEKNLARESARSEMEIALQEKKDVVSAMTTEIKKLQANRKALRQEIKEARKAAREATS